MSDNSLSSIESNIDETRAHLAATIDELLYRASPKTIANREVNKVKSFFVDSNGPRVDNIAKVAGGVVGVVVVITLVRKLVS